MTATNLLFLALSAKSLDIASFSKHEAILTSRGEVLQHRVHEVATMVSLVEELSQHLKLEDFDGFVFSYSIPQLGREFDLLKITDEMTLNIELKSKMVDLDDIKKQLKEHRHYLSHLGKKELYLFTYISTDKKIYSLAGDALVEISMAELAQIVQAAGSEYFKGDYDQLFLPKMFLVSPLNTPQKFIDGEYFLSDSQENIRREILRGIKNKQSDAPCFFRIIGDPGTGKTLLLYDIAKQLARTYKVCVVHCGMLCDGHKQINDSIDNLTVVAVKYLYFVESDDYDIFLFDESHRLYLSQFNDVIKYITKASKVGIFSIDPKQILSKNEQRAAINQRLDAVKGLQSYKLKNKIRTNKELASFIKKLMYVKDSDPKEPYKNVKVLYAENYKQANKLITYHQMQGYEYISYTLSRHYNCSLDKLLKSVNTHEVIGQEFDNVIMAVDSTFGYNADGYLVADEHPNPDYLFRQLLFQGVTRVREKLVIVVIKNEELFKNIIGILSDAA